MATWFTTSEVIELLDDNDFGLSGEEARDFEGEEIASYLPSGVLQLSERDGVEEDHNEAMEVEEMEDLDILLEYEEGSGEVGSDESLGNRFIFLSKL